MNMVDYSAARVAVPSAAMETFIVGNVSKGVGAKTK